MQRERGKNLKIINPNHKNPSPTSAIEPPIWCAYFGGDIIDAEAEGLSIDETVERVGDDGCIIVVMGANPSASSTPKMGVSLELKKRLPNAQLFGLHFGKSVPVKELARMTPNWESIDFSKYKAHNWHCLDRDRMNYGVIYTSFGCPFDCYYCNIHTLYKGVTFRDSQDVIEEIGYLVKRGVRNLKIADELFTLNESHVNEICDLLIERDYGLNIWAYARANILASPLLRKMKSAGINWLCFGFESANDKVLQGVGKKQGYWDMVFSRYDALYAGINVLGNFIFGLPDDNMETMQETLDFAKFLRCEYVNFYCAVAYPGSRLYEDTPKENLPEKWEDYDQYSPNFKPLPTKYLTGEQVLKFRDEAFIDYFSDEKYLNMIESKFGASNQIREMLSWRPRGGYR